MTSIRDRIKRVLDEHHRVPPPPERRFNERRRAVANAMLNPAKRHDRLAVLKFIRRDKKARDLRHFFDEIATESDVRHVERLLGI